MSISGGSVSGTNPSNPNSTLATQARQYSTLPRKLHGSGKLQALPPPPPKRDPNTTLSVGRARARSMVANLAAIEALDKAINEHDSSTSESVTGSVDSVQRMPDLVPEMNVNGNGNNSSPNGSDDANNKSKVYASVSEMKRMKLQASMKSKSAEENKNSLPSPMTATSIHEISSQEEKDSPTSTSGLLRKGFHSTPDLNKNGLNFPPNNSTPMDLASELKTFQFKAKTDLDIICMNKPLNEVNDQ